MEGVQPLDYEEVWQDASQQPHDVRGAPPPMPALPLRQGVDAHEVLGQEYHALPLQRGFPGVRRTVAAHHEGQHFQLGGLRTTMALRLMRVVVDNVCRENHGCSKYFFLMSRLPSSASSQRLLSLTVNNRRNCSCSCFSYVKRRSTSSRWR